MNKKYELLEREENGLCRIRALKDFDDVKAGDVGGYIEKEDNLSQTGGCWIYGNARVYGYAEVYDNAKVCDYAEVYGNAEVFGNTRVYENAEVFGNVKVCGNANVYGCSEVCENAEVFGNTRVYGYAKVFGNVRVYTGRIIGTINEEYEKIFFIQTKNRTITIYTKNGELYCNIGCQKRMTYDMLERRIEKDGGISPRRQEYLDLMKAFEYLIK